MPVTRTDPKGMDFYLSYRRLDDELLLVFCFSTRGTIRVRWEDGVLDGIECVGNQVGDGREGCHTSGMAL